MPTFPIILAHGAAGSLDEVVSIIGVALIVIYMLVVIIGDRKRKRQNPPQEQSTAGYPDATHSETSDSKDSDIQLS